VKKNYRNFPCTIPADHIRVNADIKRAQNNGILEYRNDGTMGTSENQELFIPDLFPLFQHYCFFKMMKENLCRFMNIAARNVVR
jgi:hypothetical protein